MSVDRGFTWMDDETLALIEIFSTDEIQQELNGSKRNIGVYEKIANELGKAGYRRTAYQCREKIKRLRKEYHLAKNCIEKDVLPKKPMKYYELVDKIFNQDSSTSTTNVELNILSAELSDNEEELHFTFNPETESDVSASCHLGEAFALQPSLPAKKDCNSPLMDNQSEASSSSGNENSNESLEQISANYKLSDKDSPLDEHESPWVPNVVLIENDSESIGLDHNANTPRDNEDDLDGDELEDFPHSSLSPSHLKECVPPPRKKRKSSSAHDLRKVLDSVTDTFFRYQEIVESQLLERLLQLEKERMRRDESMQRLWMEFEERRRKEDRQHELKMLSLLGQFIQQIGGAER